LNPFFGCTKISPGCNECYAELMAARLKEMGQPYYREVIERGHWSGDFNVNLDVMNKALHWVKPRMIFINSMSDTFHEYFLFEWIDKIIDVIKQTPRHTYLILTKRPERMLEYFTVHAPEKLPNLWIGVTAENQEQASKRIPILIKIPAAKRFVSIEPMLESIDLTGYYFTHSNGSYAFKNVPESGRTKWIDLLDWVICGCESGPRRRTMDIEWVRYLKNQCVRSNVPFFFKQKYIGGKKIKMPMLDDQIWDQYPEP
jgi:protein gp37